MLQVSLLINKQMGGKKKKKTVENGRERGRRARLVDYAFWKRSSDSPAQVWLALPLTWKKAAGQDLDRSRFRKAWCTSLVLLLLSLPLFSSSSLPFVYWSRARLEASPRESRLNLLMGSLIFVFLITSCQTHVTIWWQIKDIGNLFSQSVSKGILTQLSQFCSYQTDLQLEFDINSNKLCSKTDILEQ